MAISQKPRIGLKDVKYALLTESSDVIGGTPTWGTVYSLTNAIELSFDPASSASTLFADDGAAFSAETTGEMTISLGLADILPDDMARILGHTYANGIVNETTDDASPYIAIGGKRTMPGGTYEYFWLPKVKLNKPASTATTKGSSIEFQTPMLEGRVLKLTANNNYRTRVRTDDTNASATTISNWFAAPVFDDSADLGALNVVVAKNTTKARFTFTKTGGGNITLQAADLTTANLPTFKGSNAVPVAGTYAITSGNGTGTVVIDFTPTVAYGAVAVSGAVSPYGIKDQNGVYATQTGAVWTSD
jgi:phi13 family phage major tail protein